MLYTPLPLDPLRTLATLEIKLVPNMRTNELLYPPLLVIVRCFAWKWNS